MEVENKSSNPAYGSCSTIISNLPFNTTNTILKDYLYQTGQVRKSFLVRDKDYNFTGVAYVTFFTPEEAERSLSLNNTSLNGQTIHVKRSKPQKEKTKSKAPPVRRLVDETAHVPTKVWPRKRQSQFTKAQKEGRIVVRNIAFQCTEQHLEKFFSPYGKLLDLNMLRNDNGRLKGVAFVQYDGRESAQNAINGCNLKKFMGRMIAVDFSVEKSKYVQNQQNNQSFKTEIKDEIKIEPEDSSQSDARKKTVVSGEGMDTDEMKEENKEENDLDTSYVKDEPMSSDEDEKKSNDDESSSDEEQPLNDVKFDEDHEENDDESSSDEEDEEKSIKKYDKKKEPPERKFDATQRSKDVIENRTLFVRSISFNSTEQHVSDLFSKYGNVKQVAFCKDGVTKRFKGSAFVHYYDGDSAKKSLEAYEDPAYRRDFFLDGRCLFLFMAAGRTDIKPSEGNVNKKMEGKDKRNLYLAKEGIIRDDSEAADGVSKTDLALRKNLSKLKKNQLKNLHMFISSVRLCIHNLLDSIDDKEMRKIFRKHSPEGAVITECKVMKNLFNVDQEGKASSKGFGFVTFTKHEDALAALRKINNNPEIFNDKKRPIVEFSMENQGALRARQKRLEKSQQKNPTSKKYIKPNDNDEDSQNINLKYAKKNSKLPFSGKTAKVFTEKSNLFKNSDNSNKITRNQINNSMRKKVKGREFKHVNNKGGKKGKGKGYGEKRKQKKMGNQSTGNKKKQK